MAHIFEVRSKEGFTLASEYDFQTAQREATSNPAAQKIVKVSMDAGDFSDYKEVWSR